MDPRHLGRPGDRSASSPDVGNGEMTMPTVRLTVAQVLVRFLASQYTERDGVRQRLIEGCWSIFGHGQGSSGRAGAVPRVGPDHGHLYRDRPARPGALLGELVGRAGVADFRAGQHAAGPYGLRGGPARPADVPVGKADVTQAS